MSSPVVLIRGRPATTAEYSRTVPNTMAMAAVETLAARNAPRIAPSVVAISRNIPMRILEIPSFT